MTSKNPDSNTSEEERRLRERLRERAKKKKDPENGLHDRPSAAASSSTNDENHHSIRETNNQKKKHHNNSDSSKPDTRHHEDQRSTQQKARSRKRRRERRRMNREVRRRGSGALPYNARPPPRDPYFRRGADARGRWDGRGGGGGYGAYPPPPQGGNPPDYRGPPNRRGASPRGVYRRSRSRSPRHRRRRSRSLSSDRSSASSRSRSSSRSHSRSRSRSRSVSKSSSRSRSPHDRKQDRPPPRRNSGGSSGRRRDDRDWKERRGGYNRRGSSSDSSSSVSSSSSSSSEDEGPAHTDESNFSKDQRTVFVSQLIMRTTEKEIRKYFKKKLGCKVKEVILLRDKRTGNHKGHAYLEFSRMEDVQKALAVTGQPPDFQRFPILVKASEAEKNYAVPTSSSVVTASMMGAKATKAPLLSEDGRLIEAQKVYVGGFDPSVTQEHIFAIFSQFGQLEKVTMQMDPSTASSRGYAFLAFRDPKEANLAIQTMSNQVVGGRPIKTGWANQMSSLAGVEIVTSEEYPENANARAQKAMLVLAQLMGTPAASAVLTAERAVDPAVGSSNSGSAVPTVAEARASLVASQTAHSVLRTPLVLATNPIKMIGGLEQPTRFVLIHNMFDKDQETEEGWPKEIQEEFEEECSKFGKITFVKVMSEEPGGKIYASFENVESAETCAKNLAGRWFDKRQLRVDFLEESDFPKE